MQFVKFIQIVVFKSKSKDWQDYFDRTVDFLGRATFFIRYQYVSTVAAQIELLISNRYDPQDLF